MVRRRRRQRLIPEQQTSYLFNPDPPLPPYASTLDEIQRAVERNSIKRGVFIIKNLLALDFDGLLQDVKRIANQYDKEEWREVADRLCIDIEALHILDNASSPIPYPYYFCTPDILREHPKLITYYRNVAMMSQKVMNDMGLSTIGYEAGLVAPPPDIAQSLAYHFNQIVSSLVKTGQITPRRHLEMAYANMGDSIGGAWRNEVGARPSP
ncbi:MAG: hypothetical protein Kow0063_01300 [Anaerolineae bacterium]